MHQTKRGIVALTSIGLMALVACAGGGGGGSPTPHSISGTVSGAVQAGVTVMLSGAASATTTTGAGGTYAFTGLADGSYSVTPSRAGFTFLPASRAVTLAGADSGGNDFTANTVVADPPHSISGTVSGAVQAAVTVTLSGGGTRTTTTDPGGNYSFAGVANGSYTVTPSSAGIAFSPPARAVSVDGASVTGAGFQALDPEYANWPIPASSPGVADYTVDEAAGTVTDNVTGLVWQRTASSAFIGWTDARSHCASLNPAGMSAGWRLPTIMELTSILDHGVRDPAIDGEAFPLTASAMFWSSSDYAGTAGYAWGMNFRDGGNDWEGHKSLATAAVRCVRLGPNASAPAVRYTPSADVVVDNATGLVWQRSPGAPRTFAEASSTCAALSLGAWPSGWRLPTLKELHSIVRVRSFNPAIDAAVFPGTPADVFWSSTANVGAASTRWVVDFWDGLDFYGPETHSANVRCVR